MCGTTACLAVAVLGIDAGWQPLSDGGLEYIIQITPRRLEALADGKTIWSDIPPGLHGIRSCRIEVGTRQLPQESGPQPAAAGSGITETMAKEGPEFPIRLTSQQLGTLRLGVPVSSDIPPNVKGIRTYRIEVATEESSGPSIPQPAADRAETAETIADKPAADRAETSETMVKEPASGPLAPPAVSSAGHSQTAEPARLSPAPDSKPIPERLHNPFLNLYRRVCEAHGQGDCGRVSWLAVCGPCKFPHLNRKCWEPGGEQYPWVWESFRMGKIGSDEFVEAAGGAVVSGSERL